jgi:hypothetical protein
MARNFIPDYCPAIDLSGLFITCDNRGVAN